MAPMTQTPPHSQPSDPAAAGSNRSSPPDGPEVEAGEWPPPAPDAPAPAAGDATRRAAPVADRVLILRLGAMGDVIRTLPAVAAIRSLYPGAHLSWLVEPASAGVVEVSGLVDETLVFPRRALFEAFREGDALSFGRRLGGFLETLRQRRFEISLDFHGILKSGLLSFLSGAPMRVGFARPVGREGAPLLANRLVYGVDPEGSRFARNAALVRALDPRVEIPERPLLKPSSLAQARLAARLRATGRESAGGFALIHPGSSAGAQHKRYAPEAWAAVARRLAARGVEVWIAAGPNRHERNLAESISRRAEGALVLAPETRSFDDLLALQARAGVFIAADSGPLHAASLSGVPVVQLLGPTHPVQNEPWSGTPSRRLHVPLACSPCRRGCADPACMRSIPAEAVADRACELLASVADAERTGRARRERIPGASDASGETLA